MHSFLHKYKKSQKKLLKKVIRKATSADFFFHIFFSFSLSEFCLLQKLSVYFSFKILEFLTR